MLRSHNYVGAYMNILKDHEHLGYQLDIQCKRLQAFEAKPVGYLSSLKWISSPGVQHLDRHQLNKTSLSLCESAVRKSFQFRVCHIMSKITLLIYRSENFTADFVYSELMIFIFVI